MVGGAARAGRSRVRVRPRSRLRGIAQAIVIIDLRHLPLLVWQKLAAVSYDHPVALRVFLLADIHLEVDRTHDPISEHLMNQGFDGCAIDLGDLVKTVDQRVNWDGAVKR